MDLKKTVFAACFLFLILISFGVKLIEFDNPFSGFHQKRQLDNVVAIENYFLEGVELKRRTTSGSYVLFELPVYQAIVAYLSSSLNDVLFFARSVNLVFAFLSIFLIFKISEALFDFKTAIYATLFFAFAPLNLSYHRAVMMDISSVFFCLAATWLLIAHLNNINKFWHLPLFVLAGCLSVVTKPLYFFPVGAIALANFINQYQSPFPVNAINYIKKNLGLVVSFILITATMLGWVWVVGSVNESGSLLDLLKSWIFLLAPKYYALLVFRFTLLILNPFTFLLFIIGMLIILSRYRDKDSIALPFLIPLYFLFFGQLNFPHEYYALIMVPYCSLVAGVGASWLEGILVSNNLIINQKWTLGILCFFSSIVSVLIFFLNFLVSSPNLEQRSVQIEKEMKSVLEPRQISQVYINKPNFPLSDYIKYNRSLYLSHALNVRSEKDIREYGLPITSNEVLYALRQYGAIEFTQKSIPKVDLSQVQLDHTGKLRYIMFYRYFSDQSYNIKESMSEYKIFYESSDWIVYDLNLNK
jgi:hypothetical protein